MKNARGNYAIAVFALGRRSGKTGVTSLKILSSKAWGTGDMKDTIKSGSCASILNTSKLKSLFLSFQSILWLLLSFGSLHNGCQHQGGGVVTVRAKHWMSRYRHLLCGHVCWQTNTSIAGAKGFSLSVAARLTRLKLRYKELDLKFPQSTYGRNFRRGSRLPSNLTSISRSGEGLLIFDELRSLSTRRATLLEVAYQALSPRSPIWEVGQDLTPWIPVRIFFWDLYKQTSGDYMAVAQANLGN